MDVLETHSEKHAGYCSGWWLSDDEIRQISHERAMSVTDDARFWHSDAVAVRLVFTLNSDWLKELLVCKSVDIFPKICNTLLFGSSVLFMARKDVF